MKLPTQSRGLKQSMKMAEISLRCILKYLIKGGINILMVSERKINIFPHNQFFIEGFCSPCRLDCDSNSGGILLCQGGYPLQLNCTRKQTNWKPLCRAKLTCLIIND